MAGIVGIDGSEKNRQATCVRMLDKITHRGSAGSKIVKSHGVMLGAVWPQAQVMPTSPTLQKQAAWDGNRPPLPDPFPDELVDITRRLSNTALQRVDRSASSHGLVAHVAFLDSDVVDYTLRIPPELKLRRDDEVTEKWILRQALTDVLPDEVLWRRKAKFWQGAGVGELLAQYADDQITDDNFKRERALPNGWTLNTKEEVMYYRIFKEHFGELNDLSWMGRTKGAPKH
jgi:asparagine synthetase B (glutamine-hydrolysing)